MDKTSENNTYKIESQKMYTSVERIYNNAENPRINYGDSLQLTNWILDSGATCHMTPDISDLY